MAQHPGSGKDGGRGGGALLPICYAASSALIGTQSVVQAKCFSELIEVWLSGGDVDVRTKLRGQFRLQEMLLKSVREVRAQVNR